MLFGSQWTWDDINLFYLFNGVPIQFNTTVLISVSFFILLLTPPSPRRKNTICMETCWLWLFLLTSCTEAIKIPVVHFRDNPFCKSLNPNHLPNLPRCLLSLLKSILYWSWLEALHTPDIILWMKSVNRGQESWIYMFYKKGFLASKCLISKHNCFKIRIIFEFDWYINIFPLFMNL